MEHLYPLSAHMQPMHARFLSCVCPHIVNVFLVKWNKLRTRAKNAKTLSDKMFIEEIWVYFSCMFYLKLNKLSSTAICKWMCSVISGDVLMNGTFINYPFVTMRVSSCLLLTPEAIFFCKVSTLLLITCSVSKDMSSWMRCCYSSSIAQLQTS